MVIGGAATLLLAEKGKPLSVLNDRRFSLEIRPMSMARLLVLSACLFAGALPAAAQSAPAASSATVTPAKARVQDLAWIAGAYTGTLGDRTIEQHWSAPLGNSIVAMYRSVRNDEATLYELLAIENEGEGVVLRIKHFAPGPGLVGREAKDESINHTLVSLGSRTAVFQGVGEGGAKISFSSPNAQSLLIVVERLRDGKPAATEFKYTRIAAN
jgi:hypothetical protein